ncbi:hypothetical protein [Amaricoccus sp. W119]|uniref:hypothetical protein n=1 Tax=Amaricoccus sp. W119 TaxID=3391833 RepID=UPI0039A6C9B8
MPNPMPNPMRYTAVIRLTGAPAAAVAVEWSEAAQPSGSGDGWEACVRLPNGDWRLSSHEIVAGTEAHWRGAGLFANIGLRYRLSATGPWSPISAGRKDIVLVETSEDASVTPAAPTPTQWSTPAPRVLGDGRYTGTVTLFGISAVALRWTTAPDPAADADWGACVPLGDGGWQLEGLALDGGAALEGIGLSRRIAADGEWSPVSTTRKTLETPLTLVAPVALLAPNLSGTVSGTGRIGAALTLSTGLWSGTPAPALGVEWLRDGVVIAGATGTVYIPGAADDRRAISARVTAASPAGTVVAMAGPVTITHVAPKAAGALPEEVFDKDSGVRTIAAARDFTGEALVFSVSGAGATIDAATGLVSIETGTALSGIVTVTATNSGGSARSHFTVTIEAEEVERPAAAAEGEWDVTWDYDPEFTDRATWHIRLISGPARGATRVYLRGLADVAEGMTAGNGFHACVKHPGKANVWVARSGLDGAAADWLWVNSATAKYNIIGQTRSQRIIYTLDDLLIPAADAVYSDPSNVITRTVTLPPRIGPYVRAPYHTAEQKAAGGAPCDTEQVCLSFARAKTQPARIYAGGDMHGVWVSRDSGRSWNTLRNRGLGTPTVYGLEVDPTDANKVFAICGARYSTNSAEAGIHRSLDGGLSWERVFVWTGVGEPRKIMRRLAYAPSTAAAGTDAIRWYAVFDNAAQFSSGTNTAVSGLITSADGGATWRKVGDLAEAAFGKDIYGARVHPTVPTRLFTWGTAGLIRIDNAHQGDGGYTVLSGSGGLPQGAVRGELYLSPDGAVMIVAVMGRGVYRSTNGGASWSALLSWSDVTHCAVNEGHPDYIFAYAQGVNSGPSPRISHDGGKTWFQPAAQENFPGVGGRALVGGTEPWIMPDPSNPLRAVCHAHADFMGTEDGGRTWSAADSAYFCGTHPNSYASPHCFDRTDPLKYMIPLIDRHLLETEDGGVTSVISSFRDAEGYTHGTVNGAAVHPDGRHIIACVNTGTKGILCYSDDRGGSWTTVDTPEKPRMYLGYDAGDPNYAYQFNKRSSDMGRTWTVLSRMPAESYIVGVSQVAVNGRSVLYAMDLGSSSNSAGTKKKLYKSLDRGESWTLVATVAYSFRANTDVRVVCRIHPKDPHVVFTKSASANGQSTIRRWDTGKASGLVTTDFDILSVDRPVGDFFAYNFVVDGYDPRVMYFLSNQFNTGHCLYMTEDAGATWTNISAGFPNVTALSTGLEVHPLTGVLYLGTANGMFVRKPPYPVPTPKNTYDLIVANYPDWDHNRHIDEPY